VILPKKNGKSTLVAALALYHLLTTEDAEGYIAASSRDQAGIILKQARKFIRSSPALQRHFQMKQREIVSLADEGVRPGAGVRCRHGGWRDPDARGGRRVASAQVDGPDGRLS
jgi:hypothetical protein